MRQRTGDTSTFSQTTAVLKTSLGVLLAVGLAGLPTLAAERPSITVGQTFLTGGLDPAEGSAGWALVSHGVAENLFAVSRDGRVVPALAESALRQADGSWRVTLHRDRVFSDGSPVDAATVAAALNRSGEKNPVARASAGRLTFAPLDAATLRVTTERPTPVLPAVLAEWAFPVYRETPGGMVFTGPFAVTSFTAGSRLDLTPNTYYAEAETRPEVIVRRIADGQALALAFKAGEVDLAFHLPVETLPMLKADPALAVRTFPVGYQYMMWINTRRGALTDVRVRKAIDIAIDRADLVKAARAGIPATGAYPALYPFAATGALEQDAAKAEALLDAAGWKRGAGGMRTKNGKPLELTLWAYPQRPDLITFQPVIRAALQKIGIAATTHVSETATETAKSGAFDLFLWAQHTAPAGDPAFFLGLFLASGGGNNFAGWSNPTFDTVMTRLGEAADGKARAELAREAQAIVAEEAPVAFLATPEWHVGVSKRLASYEPWGSDYYVIRDDLRVAR